MLLDHRFELMEGHGFLWPVQMECVLEAARLRDVKVLNACRWQHRDRLVGRRAPIFTIFLKSLQDVWGLCAEIFCDYAIDSLWNGCSRSTFCQGIFFWDSRDCREGTWRFLTLCWVLKMIWLLAMIRLWHMSWQSASTWSARPSSRIRILIAKWLLLQQMLPAIQILTWSIASVSHRLRGYFSNHGSLVAPHVLTGWSASAYLTAWLMMQWCWLGWCGRLAEWIDNQCSRVFPIFVLLQLIRTPFRYKSWGFVAS